MRALILLIAFAISCNSNLNKTNDWGSDTVYSDAQLSAPNASNNTLLTVDSLGDIQPDTIKVLILVTNTSWDHNVAVHMKGYLTFKWNVYLYDSNFERLDPEWIIWDYRQYNWKY